MTLIVKRTKRGAWSFASIYCSPKWIFRTLCVSCIGLVFWVDVFVVVPPLQDYDNNNNNNSMPVAILRHSIVQRNQAQKVATAVPPQQTQRSSSSTSHWHEEKDIVSTVKKFGETTRSVLHKFDDLIHRDPMAGDVVVKRNPQRRMTNGSEGDDQDDDQDDEKEEEGDDAVEQGDVEEDQDMANSNEDDGEDYEKDSDDEQNNVDNKHAEETDEEDRSSTEVDEDVEMLTDTKKDNGKAILNYKRYIMEISGLTGKGESTEGRVVIETRPAWAPIGADHFDTLVARGFYDQCRFFRVLSNFVIQFGISGNPDIQKKWRSNLLHDDPVQHSNKKWTVTYATSGPNTRTTQLFINTHDNEFLDAQGFAPFAMIVEGMEYLERIDDEYKEQPDQTKIQRLGNDYLQKSFPKMSYISRLYEDTNFVVEGLGELNYEGGGKKKRFR